MVEIYRDVLWAMAVGAAGGVRFGGAWGVEGFGVRAVAGVGEGAAATARGELAAVASRAVDTDRDPYDRREYDHAYYRVLYLQLQIHEQRG